MEAGKTSKNGLIKPNLKITDFKLSAKKTDLVVKAGDLSMHITSFIGALRDDYMAYISHELKSKLYLASIKIFNDFSMQFRS